MSYSASPSPPPPGFLQPPITATAAEIADYKNLRRRHWRAVVGMAILLALAGLPPALRQYQWLQLIAGNGGGMLSSISALLVVLGGWWLFCLLFMFYSLGRGVHTPSSLLGACLPGALLLFIAVMTAREDTPTDMAVALSSGFISLLSMILLIHASHLRDRIQRYRDLWHMDDTNNAAPPPPPVDPLEELDIPADWDSAKPPPPAPHAPADPPHNTPRDRW